LHASPGVINDDPKVVFDLNLTVPGMKIFIGPFVLAIRGEGGLLYHQGITMQVGEGRGIGILGPTYNLYLKHLEVARSPLACARIYRPSFREN
jgi:hypothetical protein